MHGQKRIVIAEDHTILRDGLKMLLASDASIEIVGEAGDGIEAVDSVASLKPDLILLDLAMPRMDGLAAIQEIKKRNPSTKILVLSVHKTEGAILSAFNSGADGYIPKDAAARELSLAIDDIFSGKRYLSPIISEKVTNDDDIEGKSLKPSSSFTTLTGREVQILKMIAEDCKNKDIARFLGISEKTVEKHRTNLMRKLNLHSASALTAFALSEGLIIK